MWRRLTSAAVIVVVLLLVFWLWRAPAYAAPYVKCPTGEIVPVYKDCPEDEDAPRPRMPSGGEPGGGVIGDLLDRVGLGGLGGITDRLPGPL